LAAETAATYRSLLLNRETRDLPSFLLSLDSTERDTTLAGPRIIARLVPAGSR
jgi:hypothetical protein